LLQILSPSVLPSHTTVVGTGVAPPPGTVGPPDVGTAVGFTPQSPENPLQYPEQQLPSVVQAFPLFLQFDDVGTAVGAHSVPPEQLYEEQQV
jgi:hypothetical protein